MQSDDQTLTPPKGINNNNKNSRTCPCKKYNKRLRVLWKPINAETTTNTERRRSKAKHGTKFAFSQQTPPSKMSFWRSLSHFSVDKMSNQSGSAQSLQQSQRGRSLRNTSY